MDFRDFKNIKEEYLPGVVWDWCALPVAEEIDATLQSFEEKMITGVIIRPLPSLSVKYGGDDYFELIRTAARRSARHGIKLWIWDENRPFSGSGGGEIVSVPDYRAKYIVKISEADVRKDDVVLSKDEKACHVVRTDSADCAADIFSAEVGECFAQATYDKYRHNCSRFTGNEICGFVSCLYSGGEQFPYNKEVFQNKNTFPENAEERAELIAALDDAAEKNFAQIAAENCHSHNMTYSVNTCGNILSRQRYRMLSDEPYTVFDTENPDFADIMLLKSVCAQFDKKSCVHIKTPTFSNTNVRRNATGLLSVMGVNKIFYDAVPYSVISKQKYSSGRTVLLKNDEALMSEYCARLARITAETQQETDTLLLVPTGFLMSETGEDYKTEYEKINKLCRSMLTDGADFHMADEYMLTNHASVGNDIKIGKCRYNTIIVPDGMKLSSDAEKTLEAFKGEILYAQPDLKEHNINIKADGEAFLSYYTNEGKECCMAYFPKDCTAKVQCTQPLTLADIANGEMYDLAMQNERTVKISGGSCLLFICDDASFSAQLPSVTDGALWQCFEKKMDCMSVLCGADENILPLKNVNACFGKKASRDEIIDNLYDRFLSLPDGETVKLKYPFYISQTDIGDITAYIENAYNMEEILLNGKTVPVKQCGYGYCLADISRIAVYGKNTFSLEYKKSSKYLPESGKVSPRSFAARGETSLEAIYLCGDFDTDGEKITACEINGENVAENAMPYYYGEIKYAVKLPDEISGGVLEIDGGFNLCKIKIGKREEICFSSPARIELFSLDSMGAAEITLENTPRNLFSAKNAQKEPFGISSVKILY